MQAGPVEWNDACEIIRQIARALEAAHAKGIIHRDLKPENVFLKKSDDDKPVVKLLDFGLAKSTNKDDLANLAKTRSGQMLGTPLYMSPEQCKNKGVDHRTDIYALGCMCFELLVGRIPYDADNVAEIITAHLVAEPPRPSKFKPDIPADIDKLLFGMIQKEPEKRPPLGEIRRLIGMQISRGSDALAHIASSPYVTPLPGTLSRITPQDGMEKLSSPPVKEPSSAGVSLTDDEMIAALKKGGIPWYFWVAVSVLVIVVAAIVVLR
jgi:serine/threonine-protein kinase